MIAEAAFRRRRVERRLPTPDRLAANGPEGSVRRASPRVGDGATRVDERLLEIQSRTTTARLTTYLDVLRDEICWDCRAYGRPASACPLKYLLPSASQDAGTVEQRRRRLGEQLAWPDDEMPETD